MRIKTPREKRVLYIKTCIRWILYIMLIILGFCIMTSGSLMKPVVLVPIAAAIAVNNNMYASMVTGTVCGLMTDIACGRLFGYNAQLLLVSCAAVTLVYEMYLRKKFFNYLCMTALISFVQCRLDYEFYYKIWSYENVERIFTGVTMRVWIYTVISSVFVYFTVKGIDKLLLPKNHFTIEEVMKLSSQPEIKR